MSNITVVSIRSLSSHSVRWKILGQCTSVLADPDCEDLVREFELTDKEGDTIRVFPGTQTELTTKKVKIGESYTLEDCIIQEEKEKSTGHGYALKMRSATDLKVRRNTKVVLPVDINSLSLDKVARKEQVGKVVNVIALVGKIGQIGQDKMTRTVELIDESGSNVDMILLRGKAQLVHEEKLEKVIFINGGTVSKQTETGVNFLHGGKWLLLDADVPRARELLDWNAKRPRGAKASTTSVQKAAHTSCVKEEQKLEEAVADLNVNDISLKDLPNHVGKKVNILTVIDVVGNKKEVETNSGARTKLIVKLVDKTESANLVLWDKQVDAFTAEEGTVLAIEGVKVEDPSGYVSLAGGRKSFPADDAARMMKSWYETRSQPSTSREVEPQINVQEVEVEKTVTKTKTKKKTRGVTHKKL